MKMKSSFILKASTALVLALLMLFGTVATSFAAVVDELADTGYGLSGATNVKVMFDNDSNNSGTIDGNSITSTPYFASLTHDGTGQHWYAGLYVKANTNSNTWTYNIKFNFDGNYRSAGDWIYYDNNSSLYPPVYDNKNDDKISVSGSSSNGYRKIWVNIYGQDNNDYVEVKIDKEDVSALSYSSLTPGSANLEPGGTTTLTPSVSGGSGDYNHSYVVRKGSSSGTTVSGCMSGNTFTAPSVTSSTTYYITDTVTDKKCPGLASKTKTTSITVAPKENYYLWGGKNKELHQTVYLTTLAYNSTTGRYEGSYTFDTATWYSMMPSSASNTSTFTRVWNSYSEEAWSLDTYNNGTVYKNYSSYHKETMSDGAFSSIEITNYNSSGTDSHGLHLSVREANTTINISYDASTETLYFSGAETKYATVYAKDGCINEGRQTTRVLGTTTVTADTNVTGVTRKTIAYADELISGSSTTECYTQATATKGEDITVTTTVKSAYASKYLVKGWDVNGTTYGLDPTAVGNDYSATFTVPDESKVEITPIYWLKSGDTTTFFVKDFNTVPSGWGTALYYYYWGGSQVDVGKEEKYPGQPFVHEGGQYYAQVPSDVTGVTLNNAIWDSIHGKTIMGKGGDESANHYQTYDYDNFAKIIKEKSGINSVYFTFKYETVKDNFGSSSGTTGSITLSDFGSSGNGWENYKDPLGRDINIFGGTDVSGTGTLYAVSNGYARNYQGDYATEWSIYYASSSSATTASYICTIPSSALILDASTDFANYSGTGWTPALSDYQTAWNTLKNSYSTAHVKISYEKAIFNGKTQVNTTGDTPDASKDDKATRMDGKWDYTLNSDYVEATIKVQYSDDNGSTYSDDTISSGNTFTKTGASAYFNNDGAAYQNTRQVTTAMQIPLSTTNKFELKTVPAPSTGYVFVGWYRLDDSSDKPELIGTTTEEKSLMSAKATFYARYKKVTEGTLVINHTTAGAGTSTNHTVKAEVYESTATPGTDTPLATFEGETVSIGSAYIKSSSTYKIRITLTAKSGADSYIANSSAVPTVACSQAAATYYNNPSYTRTGRYAASTYPINVTTTVDTFNISSIYGGDTTQDFTVLNYTTTFNKLPTYTIYYKYHGRGQSGNNYLTFTRTFTLSADEAEGKNSSGSTYTGNAGNAGRPTYITSAGDGLVNDFTAYAPNENDLQTEVFNKDIVWTAPTSDPGVNSATITATEPAKTYTLTYKYVDAGGTEHTATVSDQPYNKLITLDGTSGTYATRETNSSGQKFAYWKDTATGNPLTNTREYKMRLVNTVSIEPVYGDGANGWYSAIDKITRTHQTSDNSDSIFTDFALRFSGFDENGSFLHINPNYLTKYRIGVAVVYDTNGNNTTLTTEQINNTPFYDLTKSTRYGTKEAMVQLMVNNNKTSARLGDVGDTTYVTMFDANTSLLTNFNRLDYAIKYNYSTYYKRSYDAYAYIIDTTNTASGNSHGTVVAVSPVKSGYLYDGKLPTGN